MPEETFETPQPTQPVESKSSNWPKIILAAVLGFGLLATAAYAGYWYGTQQVQQPEKPTPVVSQPTPKPTPTPEATPSLTPTVEDETKDWKTYTNSEYKISFKYPKDWDFTVYDLGEKHEDNKTIFHVSILSTKDFKNRALIANDKDVLSVGVKVWNNEKGLSLNPVLSEWDSFWQNPDADSVYTKEVNQTEWLVRELTNASVLPIVEFCTLRDAGLYVLSAAPRDSNLYNYFDQILSTFRFLD